MKKTLLTIVVMALAFTSCKKQEPLDQKQPNGPTPDCNCGVIVWRSNVGEEIIVSGQLRIPIKARNNCTNNIETFHVSYPSLTENFVSDPYCKGTQW